MIRVKKAIPFGIAFFMCLIPYTLKLNKSMHNLKNQFPQQLALVGRIIIDA